MPRRRPSLESLEGRYAPAVADVAGGVGDTVRVSGVFDASLQDVSASIALPAAPLQLFAGAASVDGGRVFFRPLALPDVLMSQIGRLPKQSMEFPASGGGDRVKPPEEVAQLVPATPPAPTPAAAQPEADAVDAESPDGGEAAEA